MTTQALFAQLQTDVLGRSLLIAAVIVSPYAIYKWRQVQRTRAETAAILAAAQAPEVTVERDRLEDVIDEVHRVAADLDAGRGATIRIGRDLTVDGSAAPDTLVDALVRDALRRSGLVATAELETPDARVLEVARHDGAAGARRAEPSS